MHGKPNVGPQQDHMSAQAQHGDQRLLSGKVDDAVRDDLWQRASPATKAHLNLVAAPGAGAYLQAPPCRALGTDFPHSLMQVALQRRLRHQLLEEEAFCPACGEVMDVFADHALTCSCRGDRTKRHNCIRNQA